MILVVEQEYLKNGFTYDGGPTVITAPYLINELLNFKKNPNYIKLQQQTWYQFIFRTNLGLIILEMKLK